MTCNPNDVTANPSSIPVTPTIPGFGQPFGLKLPTNSFPDGFPEDLNELFSRLQLLVPSGALKPALNPNYGKDVYDSIMKLMDYFTPFLMLYKFFLPVLNMVICVIEVLCSLPNPFKLVRALRKLFRKCIPEFLNLFPIFSLIIMLLSLVFLLLELINYLSEKIKSLANLLLRNFKALVSAIAIAQENSILAITKKIGTVLCSFQNLFVLLQLFTAIFQVIKDIITKTFSIPPCDDSVNSDCCTSDVCPTFIKNGDFSRETGSLTYFPQVYAISSLVLPGGLGNFNVEVRPQSYQIYDGYQTQEQKFINMIDAFDVDPDPALNNTKPVFFPTDTTYNKSTPPKQAPYRTDIRVFYKPSSWGRLGTPRYIRFNDCNVIAPATATRSLSDNTTESIPSGVLKLAGGYGFEDNGITPLIPFEADGITPTTGQATLENFLFKPIVYSTNPVLTPFDGYSFRNNVDYTFKINHEVLAGKDIITIGCIPELNEDKTFTNATTVGDLNSKIIKLNGLATRFPDTAGTQECLDTALAGLRSNFNEESIAKFQAISTICLNNLNDQANDMFSDLIGIGFDVYKSDFIIDPTVQFTSKSIKVKIELKDKNGLSLSTNLSETVSTNLAARLSANPTLGQVSNFTYDGSRFFIADLTGNQIGQGTITAQLDNNLFSILTVPDDLDQPQTSSVITLSYQFIGSATQVTGSTGDDTAKPRRDERDV